jgi:hypothetical protein
VNYPERIEAAMLRRIDIDDELASKGLAMRATELAVTLDVCGAKDDKGKLILTNDKQREAAVSEMLSGNEDFKRLYGQVRDLERERKVVDATLERLRLESKYELEAARQRNLMAELKVADAIFEARTARPASVGAAIPFPLINGAAESDIDMPF